MFRGTRLLVGLAASVALVAAFGPGAARAGEASVSTAKTATATLDLGVLEQLNQIRAAHGLAQLALDPQLSAAARSHSTQMVSDGYFAHNSFNGLPFWKRIAAYYPQGGADYWSVGENLYWSSGSTDATASMKAWMASPEHRANILDPSWRQIGISAVTSPDASGTYSGLDVTVITTDFGVRR